MISVQALPSEDTTSIAERAMLVDLTVTMWSAAKHDKTVSQEVAERHGSDVAMGRFRKVLMSRSALEKLRHIAAEANQEHRRRTLPWTDAGARILTSSGYFAYAEAMRKFETEWFEAVDEFVEHYPLYVDEARLRLNGLFRPEDYPPVDRLRDRFTFGYNVFPLPSRDDFRVNLSNVDNWMNFRLQNRIDIVRVIQPGDLGVFVSTAAAGACLGAARSGAGISNVPSRPTA